MLHIEFIYLLHNPHIRKLLTLLRSHQQPQLIFFGVFQHNGLLGGTQLRKVNLEKNLTLQFKLCHKTYNLCKKVPHYERWPVGGSSIFQLLF